APPPGIRDAERVVRAQIVYQSRTGERQAMTTTSYPNFRSIAGLTGAFSAVAAVRTDTVGVGRGADLEQVPAGNASGQYFAALGASPEVGRFFGPGDDELPNGSAVVVLGNAYWKRRYAGEQSVVGRDIIVNGDRFSIIGVVPSGFNGDGLSEVDV